MPTPKLKDVRGLGILNYVHVYEQGRGVFILSPRLTFYAHSYFQLVSP